MTNVEQYINNDKHCFPPTINTEQGINIPKRCSEHLHVDKYLSEFKTNLEKMLVMQNILLMDTVPKENSKRLVDSGTVYKLMREGKLERDQLTELFNYLQRNKADKSELFNKDYRDLTNTPKNLSDFNNNLNFIQQQNLENYYDKNEIDNIIQNIALGNIDLSNYALKSELFSGSYNDLTDKPTLVTQEYVQEQINNLIDGAPEALDTLKEISNKLNDNDNIVAQILNQIISKANKSDVYTKTQLDNLLAEEQESISNKATISDLQQINGLIQQLQSKIERLESKQDSINHVFLTQSQYNALQTYEENTLYLIVEDIEEPEEEVGTRFGDKLPIKFSEEIQVGTRFGDVLPIRFTWVFGGEFPITFS